MCELNTETPAVLQKELANTVKEFNEIIKRCPLHNKELLIKVNDEEVIYISYKGG